MKGGLGLLLMVGAAIAGLYLFMTMGGSVSGQAPDVTRPDIQAPSVNEGANEARRFANFLGDQLTSWNSTVWMWVAIFLCVLIARYFVKKVPLAVWIGVGIIVGIIIMSVA